MPIFTDCSPRAWIGRGETTLSAAHAKPAFNTVRRVNGCLHLRFVLRSIGAKRRDGDGAEPTIYSAALNRTTRIKSRAGVIKQNACRPSVLALPHARRCAHELGADRALAQDDTTRTFAGALAALSHHVARLVPAIGLRRPARMAHTSHRHLSSFPDGPR